MTAKPGDEGEVENTEPEMVPKFDITSPYGTIYGDCSGAKYIQAGHYFKPKGEYLFSTKNAGDPPGGYAKKGTPSAMPKLPMTPKQLQNFEREQRKQEVAQPVEQEPPVDVIGKVNLPKDGETPLHELHWSQLKKLVEQEGGTWADKQTAIAFLQQ